MRVKSGLWVKAHIRRCNGESVMAVVARSGHEAAGAIYIKVNILNGQAAIYGPAPTGMEISDGERRWVCASGNEPVSEADADAYLVRQGEFDPDFWIIEIEDKEGRHLLGSALVSLEI